MNPLNPNKNIDISIFLSLSQKIAENETDFEAKMRQVLARDNRYSIDAYNFVMNALNYTLSELDKHRHISGRELVEGIREYALLLYGPMAKTILLHWGIKNTIDFGDIVFNMIEAGLMRRRDEDTKEEFQDVYDFEMAFEEPYKRSIAPKIRYRQSKKDLN